MVCDNPYLLIIVEAQKYFPMIISISFNSHRFSCIIFNYSNLLEAWPHSLGPTCHTPHLTHTPSHYLINQHNSTHQPFSTDKPPAMTIILRKNQAKEGLEKGQPGWPPKVGGRPPTEGARPVPPSSYKLPLPASTFFTQAFQKSTQVSVSREGALVV